LYVIDSELKERYNASLDLEWNKSFNIAPQQNQPIVRKNSPRTIELARWSFVPHFIDSEDRKRKWRHKSIINARIESVIDKNTFSKSFKQRKCLIPSTGFYEWRDEGKQNKTPYHIKPSNGMVFSFAGFYNKGTFVILTKQSENGKMQEIHDRTPVILPKDKEDQYLDNEVSKEDLEALRISNLETEQVSKKVSNPDNVSRDILTLESKQSSLSDL
jgi:Uncharacterized conserved protein